MFLAELKPGEKTLMAKEIRGQEMLDHGNDVVNGSSTISREALEKSSDIANEDTISMSESYCDIKLERCAKHDDKLSIYCDEHELFICGQCKLLDHAGCEKYTYIPNLTEDIFESEELATVRSSIDKLQDELNETKVLADAEKEKIRRLETLAHEKIEEIRHDVNEVFDDFEKDLRKNINELKNKGIEGNSLLQADRLLDEIETEKAHLKDFIQSRRRELLFRYMKHSKQRIEQFRYRLTDIKENIRSDPYTVGSVNLKENLYATFSRSVILKTGKEPDTSLAKQEENPKGDPDELSTGYDNIDRGKKDIIGNMQLICNIDLRCEEALDAKLGKMKAIEQVRCGTTSDAGNGCITDLLVLHCGHLIVVHNAHAKIRHFVYQEKQWKPQGLLKLESGPWAATNLETNSQRVAITLPEEKSFAILSIGDNIKVASMHNVGLECRGIAYNLVDQVFVLSELGSDKFWVFDSSGRPIRSIQLTGKFVNPSFIVLSPDGAKMFVSDIHSRTVSRVDVAKKSVDSCYKGDSNCRPFGMELTKSELFVCDHGSHNLLRFEAYRDMHCVQRYSKELLKCQNAVAICPQSRRVFLSRNNLIDVHVFSL